MITSTEEEMLLCRAKGGTLIHAVAAFELKQFGQHTTAKCNYQPFGRSSERMRDRSDW